MWGYVGRRAGRVVFAVAALFVAIGGIAYATIPDSGGVIHGCYQKDVGTLRVIDPSAGDTCLASEIPISWSQTGPAGPQGPQGAPGQNGAPGANGKDGVSPTVAQVAPGDTNCAAGGAAITDAAGNTAYVCNGTNGKDGQPFSGTFTSPNGLFAINVTDNGITLTGPTGSIKLDAGTLTLNAAGPTAINAGELALNAIPITMNGSASCAPAARQGDPLNVAGVAPTPGPIVITSASIAQGSQTVCIGP
jgi:hypothetical protein